MKKILVGALVAGIILWLWQFVSYAMPNLHYASVQYTPKQDSILANLEQLGLEEGGYLMPGVPKETSWEEMDKVGEAMKGKPWAKVMYYKAWNNNMGLAMAKQVATNVFMMILVGFAISGLARQRFGNVFVLTMIFGTVGFLCFEYTNHVWYPVFDIMASFLDAGLGWGLVALWHGWWYSRNAKELYG